MFIDLRQSSSCSSAKISAVTMSFSDPHDVCIQPLRGVIKPQASMISDQVKDLTELYQQSSKKKKSLRNYSTGNYVARKNVDEILRLAVDNNINPQDLGVLESTQITEKRPVEHPTASTRLDTREAHAATSSHQTNRYLKQERNSRLCPFHDALSFVIAVPGPQIASTPLLQNS